jgi:EAL domain-containing protein (putative c-di-GMP-specific phosphodiesterase class I)
MNARAVERQSIETGLRAALKNGDFVLHYQPVVDLDSGTVTGAEALLRWRCAAGGLIAPAKFVPIAEACGLIVPIGRWVLLEACRQAQQWAGMGMPPLSIAVNISAVEFRQADFAAAVRAVLEATGFDPRMLQLEITESVLMSDADSSIAILHELKATGVRLALDDFGTGYSSLSYLKQFPIDILKIDQSFVRDIGSFADNGGIVSAVIGMGNVLDKRVVAEGIETDEQLAFLRRANCREGQGFLFAQPLPAEGFGLLLQEPASRRAAG